MVPAFVGAPGTPELVILVLVLVLLFLPVVALGGLGYLLVRRDEAGPSVEYLREEVETLRERVEELEDDGAR